MLALKQALSLVSLKKLGGWSPVDELSLEAWYQRKIGVTTVGVGLGVSEWADSSLNTHNMVQATGLERPVYNATSGAITFTSASDTNLQTTSQISLTGDFTIGLRIDTQTTNGAFLADNTSANEFFKYSSASQILFRIGGSSSQILDLDSGTFGDDYLIITRVSNVVTLYQNGVKQTGTTPTVSGTSLIDVIGLRRVDINGFDGNIKEIQIYNNSSVQLTERVNNSLKSL
jgi:hypothetical protein